MNPQQSQRIYVVIDRIAHHSTVGTDLDNSVAGLRRLLNGDVPSEVLRKRNSRKASSDFELQAVITDLRERLALVEEEKAESEHEKTCLMEEIAKLQMQLGQPSNDAAAEGYYTRAQVKQIIASMFEKDHGVCKALVEKNAAQRRSGIDLPKITDSLLQQWQRRNQYPDWAIEQLKLLTADDLLKGHKWTPEDKEFVISLWLTDPHQTNEQLAAICSQKFGAKITDSSIRGVLNRAGLLRPVKAVAGPAPHTPD